jgi:hypothetical protein
MKWGYVYLFTRLNELYTFICMFFVIMVFISMFTDIVIKNEK